jgi:hypothetical protein
MPLLFSSAVGEFLQNYRHDVELRWSAEDLRAQKEFVNSNVGDRRWIDWSSENATLQLLQAELVSTSVAADQRTEAIVLAGPIVELVPLGELLALASAFLEAGGRLVGIIPCLRDNSPESQLFTKIAATALWPYATAEELAETLREMGFVVDPQRTTFTPIREFNEAILKDQLGFKGFRRIFEELERQGYDPAEVGWGELRFVAASSDELNDFQNETLTP